MQIAQKRGFMQRELLRILTAIKEKTGINVSILSIDKGVDVSTFSDYFKIPEKHLKSLKEIYIDKDEVKTYFNFTFMGVKFIGCIEGSSEVSLNYAIFIKDYIENNEVKQLDLSYDEEYLSIILGDSSKSRTAHFITKYSISKSSVLCMVVKSNKEKAEDICEFLKDYTLSSSDNSLVLDKNTCIFIKFIDKETSDEYLSITEYARGIVRSLYEELGITANIYLGGKVASFSDINISYLQALTAERMNLAFGGKGEISSYKDFIIVKMAEDISKSKAEEYMSVILDKESKEIIKDEELLETGEEFLRNDLNISETSRILHVHRNTLIYRLNKIEKISGLDLRKFNDALDFKIVSVLNRLIK